MGLSWPDRQWLATEAKNMSTAPASNRLDRPEMTRRPIEPAQQTAARVVGFTCLFTLATVVFAQFLIGASIRVGSLHSRTTSAQVRRDPTQRGTTSEVWYKLGPVSFDSRRLLLLGDKSGCWMVTRSVCPTLRVDQWEKIVLFRRAAHTRGFWAGSNFAPETPQF